MSWTVPLSHFSSARAQPFCVNFHNCAHVCFTFGAMLPHRTARTAATNAWPLHRRVVAAGRYTLGQNG
eukprot:5931909-Lingulodinium_polyedra.AAC.1